MVSLGRSSFVILVLGVVLLSTNLVSAAQISDMVNRGIDGLVEVFRPILEFIVGETSGGSIGTSEAFLGKLLIMILLFCIVYVVMQQIPIFRDTGWALWTVSIVISMLSVRFLTPDLINTIILPNSALGVALTAGLPFVIYFFVVNGFPAVMRRLAWIFFAVVFLALWTIRLDELGDVVWIYPVTAAGALIMVLADGTIRQFMINNRMGRANAAFKGAALNDLQHQIQLAHQRYAANGAGYNGVTTAGAGLTGEAALRADVKEYERRIRHLMRT